MSGHAQCPWFCWRRSDADVLTISKARNEEEDHAADKDGKDLTVAGIWNPDDPVCQANAHLIAAAPDLLAACKLAERHHQGMHSEPGIALRAAIAKAEGR